MLTTTSSSSAGSNLAAATSSPIPSSAEGALLARLAAIEEKATAIVQAHRAAKAKESQSSMSKILGRVADRPEESVSGQGQGDTDQLFLAMASLPSASRKLGFLPPTAAASSFFLTPPRSGWLDEGAEEDEDEEMDDSEPSSRNTRSPTQQRHHHTQHQQERAHQSSPAAKLHVEPPRLEDFAEEEEEQQQQPQLQQSLQQVQPVPENAASTDAACPSASPTTSLGRRSPPRPMTREELTGRMLREAQTGTTGATASAGAAGGGSGGPGARTGAGRKSPPAMARKRMSHFFKGIDD